MHGLGNDFIIIENINGLVSDPLQLAVKVCDRHFGIGSDGIILVERSNNADIRMDIINSDGTRAEMCGNGIRCFARYVYDNNIVKKERMTVETLAGIMTVDFIKNNQEGILVRVDMGTAVFEKGSIPFDSDMDNRLYKIKIENKEYTASTMLLVVPHTVIYVDDIDTNEVIKVGKIIEHLNFYPKRTNVNFVKVIDRSRIEVRTWERGAGPTLACGTGTCASAVSCFINGFTGSMVTARLYGGMLQIEYKEGRVFMEGPAEYVCRGSLLNVK
jgi:diaminopimelate epimerase